MFGKIFNCHLLILWIHMKFTWIPSKVNPLKTTSQPKAKNHGFQSCDWGQVKNTSWQNSIFFGYTHFSGGEDMIMIMGAIITSLDRKIYYHLALKLWQLRFTYVYPFCCATTFIFNCFFMPWCHSFAASLITYLFVLDINQT